MTTPPSSPHRFRPSREVAIGAGAVLVIALALLGLGVADSGAAAGALLVLGVVLLVGGVAALLVGRVRWYSPEVRTVMAASTAAGVLLTAGGTAIASYDDAPPTQITAIAERATSVVGMGTPTTAPAPETVLVTSGVEPVVEVVAADDQDAPDDAPAAPRSTAPGASPQVTAATTTRVAASPVSQALRPAAVVSEASSGSGVVVAVVGVVEAPVATRPPAPTRAPATSTPTTSSPRPTTAPTTGPSSTPAPSTSTTTRPPSTSTSSTTARPPKPIYTPPAVVVPPKVTEQPEPPAPTPSTTSKPSTTTKPSEPEEPAEPSTPKPSTTKPEPVPEEPEPTTAPTTKPSTSAPSSSTAEASETSETRSVIDDLVRIITTGRPDSDD